MHVVYAGKTLMCLKEINLEKRDPPLDIRIRTAIRGIIATVNQETHEEFLRKGWRPSRRTDNGSCVTGGRAVKI